MPTMSRPVRRRVKSPTSRRSRGTEVNTTNQSSILSFYNVKPKEEKRRRRIVLREETSGITLGHLRRCARLGGVVPLGEFAFNHMVCELCKKGENDDSIIICDKCNKGFHLYCLKPILPSVPSGDWFCDGCVKKNKEFYNKRKIYYNEYQTEIDAFFHVRNPRSSRYNLRSSSKLNATPIMSSLPPEDKKGKGYLRCYVPSKEFDKRLNQKISLASAMDQQGIEFANELVYRKTCSIKMNNIQFDEQRHLLKEMCQSDRAVYEEALRLAKEGYMPPLIVQQDDIQGFVVIADDLIKKNTYITEYVGEVDILERNEQNSNDSIMDLLHTGDASTSLVIIPEKYGNIAHYLSGINNSKKESRKKQNVRSARYVIDGAIHVLLVASRDIKAGELLMFDYNGLEHNYPTEHFV